MVINQMRLYVDPLEQESELMNLCEDPCLGSGRVLIVCENKKIADRLARKFSMKTYYNGDYLYNGNGRVSSSFRKLHFVGSEKVNSTGNLRAMRFSHIIMYDFTNCECLKKKDIWDVMTGLCAISYIDRDNYIHFSGKYQTNILQNDTYKAYKNNYMDVQIIPQEITVEIGI